MEGGKLGEHRVMAARARVCFQKEKVDSSVKSFQEAMRGVHWILQHGAIGDDLRAVVDRRGCRCSELAGTEVERNTEDTLGSLAV